MPTTITTPLLDKETDKLTFSEKIYKKLIDEYKKLKDDPYKYFLKAAGVLNESRLTVLESDIILSAFNKGFLWKHFGFFGLIYVVRLATDVSSILYETFHLPKEVQGSKLDAYRENFKLALQDNKRLHRMVNDVVWSTLNITCLIVNPVLSVFLTLGGFGFDMLYGAGKMLYKSIQYKKAQNQFHELKEKEATLASLQENAPSSDKVLELQKSINEAKGQIVQKKVNKNINQYVKKNLSDLAVQGGLYLGMGLCCFPPTMLPGAIILACSLTVWVSRKIEHYWDEYSPPHKPLMPEASNSEILPQTPLEVTGTQSALTTKQTVNSSTKSCLKVMNNAPEVDVSVNNKNVTTKPSNLLVSTPRPELQDYNAPDSDQDTNLVPTYNRLVSAKAC